MDGDQSIKSGNDFRVRDLSQSAFGKYDLNEDRCKSPNAYTDGAGTVFHPRKPGSQLSNLNPNTVLGQNLRLTS
jgi:hypothetical protein